MISSPAFAQPPGAPRARATALRRAKASAALRASLRCIPRRAPETRRVEPNHAGHQRLHRHHARTHAPHRSTSEAPPANRHCNRVALRHGRRREKGVHDPAPRHPHLWVRDPRVRPLVQLSGHRIFSRERSKEVLHVVRSHGVVPLRKTCWKYHLPGHAVILCRFVEGHGLPAFIRIDGLVRGFRAEGHADRLFLGREGSYIFKRRLLLGAGLVRGARDDLPRFVNVGDHKLLLSLGLCRAVHVHRPGAPHAFCWRRLRQRVHRADRHVRHVLLVVPESTGGTGVQDIRIFTASWRD